MKKLEIGILLAMVAGISGLMTFAITRKVESPIETASDTLHLLYFLMLLLFMMVGGVYFAL